MIISYPNAEILKTYPKWIDKYESVERRFSDTSGGWKNFIYFGFYEFKKILLGAEVNQLKVFDC